MIQSHLPIQEKIFHKEIALIFENEQDGVDWLVKKFYKFAQETLKHRPYFTCALSGGSTPKKFYEALFQSPLNTLINWQKVLLFWSDERAVAPHHPDSNWAMAMQYFDKPPLSFSQKFRMEADSQDIAQAALQYEELILNLCPESKFDLVLLGIGDDGHTASLFPATKALESKRLVEANYVPEKKTWRMTLTFNAINTARKTAILAFGKSKAEIIKKVLTPLKDEKSIFPVQQVGSHERPVMYILDKEAASQL